MQRSSSFLALLFLCLFCACGSELLARPLEKTISDLETLIEQTRLEWQVPGVAIAIVKEDRVIFEKGFGYRNIENQLPVTPYTLFAIGSTTKAFTTFVMGMLADENRLDLDKPIIQYLPTFRLADASVQNRLTATDLVTHRSGMPSHDLLWANSHLTKKELFQRLGYLDKNKELRSEWQYNNLMYVIAGYLVEEVTGLSWEENVSRRIFKPLGMKRSNFSVITSQKDSDYALPYKRSEEGPMRLAFRDISQAGPAGSINSCVDDLTAWVKLQLNEGTWQGKPLIRRETLRQIHTPHMALKSPFEQAETETIGYGLGWFVENYRGNNRLWHTGRIDGFSANIVLLPQEKMGIIVLTNQDGSRYPNMLSNIITDRLLDLKEHDWDKDFLTQAKTYEAISQKANANKMLLYKKEAPFSHPINAYVGEYESPGYGTVSVQLKNNDLELNYYGLITPLVHCQYDLFMLEAKKEGDLALNNKPVLFQSDFSGEISHLQIPMEPTVAPIVFIRKPEKKLTSPDYLTRYTGEYDVGGEILTIACEGSALKVMMKGTTTELLPKTYETFAVAKNPSRLIRFVFDEKEKVKEAYFSIDNGLLKASKRQ